MIFCFRIKLVGQVWDLLDESCGDREGNRTVPCCSLCGLVASVRACFEPSHWGWSLGAIEMARWGSTQNYSDDGGRNVQTAAATTAAMHPDAADRWWAFNMEPASSVGPLLLQMLLRYCSTPHGSVQASDSSKRGDLRCCHHGFRLI